MFQSLQYKEVNTKTSTSRRHASDLNGHNDTICIRKLRLQLHCGLMLIHRHVVYTNNLMVMETPESLSARLSLKLIVPLSYYILK